MTEASQIVSEIEEVAKKAGERQKKMSEKGMTPDEFREAEKEAERKEEQVRSMITKLATMDSDEAKATLTATHQITQLKKLLFDLRESQGAINDPDKYGKAIQTVLGYIDELEALRSK